MTSKSSTESSTPQETETYRIPLMSWSQTHTHVSVVIAVRNTTDNPVVELTDECLTFSMETSEAKYNIQAKWFDTILSESSSWKTLHNGNLLLSLEKKEESEWFHPFANKAYKGFVQIDWSRWTDYDLEYSDDDEYDSSAPYDLGSLSQASPTDCGGDENNFMNETNDDFQNMMSGLERLGTDKDIKLPTIDEVKENMSKDDIEELLRSCDEEGCSEVDLDKVKQNVQVMDDEEEEEEEEDCGENSEDEHSENHDSEKDDTEEEKECIKESTKNDLTC